MPTLYQRKSKTGYYIRARPPGLGIITYQIEPEADEIIEDYGFNSGEIISWEIIQALKAIRCISTKKSGTIEPGDDFEPDPEQLKEASLSDREAKSLLDSIQEHHDLTQEELEQICSVLGIESPSIDTNRIQDAISQKIDLLTSSGTFPIQSTLKYNNISEIAVLPLVKSPQDQEGFIISINLISTSDHDNSDYLNLLCHTIHVSEEYGIDEWLIGFSDNQSWDANAEIIQQISHLIPVIVDELKKIEIDPGNPKNFPKLEWRDFEDVPF